MDDQTFHIFAGGFGILGGGMKEYKGLLIVEEIRAEILLHQWGDIVVAGNDGELFTVATWANTRRGKRVEVVHSAYLVDSYGPDLKRLIT